MLAVDRASSAPPPSPPSPISTVASLLRKYRSNTPSWYRGGEAASPCRSTRMLLTGKLDSLLTRWCSDSGFFPAGDSSSAPRADSIRLSSWLRLALPTRSPLYSSGVPATSASCASASRSSMLFLPRPGCALSCTMSMTRLISSFILDPSRFSVCPTLLNCPRMAFRIARSCCISSGVARRPSRTISSWKASNTFIR